MTNDNFIKHFAPEYWHSVDRLKIFPCDGNEVKNNKLLKRGINTVSDHLRKFEVLAEIANDIIPKLQLDQGELEKKGYSPAKYSRQLAAIVECCITELYASLDGMRDVIYAAFGDIKGVQKKSTGKLFERAQDDAYGNEFPKKLKQLLSDAYGDWFTTLRRYRTEFIHGSLGSCHLDTQKNKIFYMHDGLGSKTKALIIDDAAEYVNKTVMNCKSLHEEIFEFLFDALPLKPTKTLCGIYKGRAYMREINPERPLTKDSGFCVSLNYEIPCPLKDECGAYNCAIERK